MNFSLEIGPHTDLDTLPPVKDVYVTMLPGGDYKETANKSGDLIKKGFNPVPHFPARSINNDEELIRNEHVLMVIFMYQPISNHFFMQMSTLP